MLSFVRNLCRQYQTEKELAKEFVKNEMFYEMDLCKSWADGMSSDVCVDLIAHVKSTDSTTVICDVEYRVKCHAEIENRGRVKVAIARTGATKSVRLLSDN